MNSIEHERKSGDAHKAMLADESRGNRGPHSVSCRRGEPLRDNSDEEILETYHGIVRETEMTAAYDHETETMTSVYKPNSRATDRSTDTSDKGIRAQASPACESKHGSSPR